MKVLFLTNTAGQGHHSTAKALYDMLKSEGVECRIIDTYEYTDPVRYKIIDRGYLMATSKLPKAYGIFYRAFEKMPKRESLYSPMNVDNFILGLKLKKFFDNEFNPDVIVCTHVFSAQVVNVMKARGWIKAPIIGIVTDYTIHPFWEDVPYVDYIVIASEMLTMQAVKRGISKEKILPLGIPVNPKFSKKIDKAEARDMLGIDRDKLTVLLMSGSMGYGNIANVLAQIDSIDADFQIIAVCGNNNNARLRIKNMKTRKKVYCYGFVNNIDVMMDAADCIVTKPGGLTTSEALAKNLPIVMINPIPGQEERNVEFLLNNGLAINATKTVPVDEALYQLFMYPEKLENMKANIRLIGKPNASRDIANFILSLGSKNNNV